MGAVYSYHSQMALPATSTPKYMLMPAFQVTVRSMSGAGLYAVHQIGDVAVFCAAGVELDGEFHRLCPVYIRVAVQAGLVAVAGHIEVEADLGICRADIGLEFATFAEAEPVTDTGTAQFGIGDEVAPAEGVGAESHAAVQTGLAHEGGAHALGIGGCIGPVALPQGKLVVVPRTGSIR